MKHIIDHKKQNKKIIKELKKIIKDIEKEKIEVPIATIASYPENSIIDLTEINILTTRKKKRK